MNKFKIFGIILLATFATSKAQEIDQVKKVIDAEQF